MNKLISKISLLILVVTLISCNSTSDPSQNLGVLDESFNSPIGIIEFGNPDNAYYHAIDLAQQQNGKTVLLVETTQTIGGFSLTRFDGQGIPDLTFGTNGLVVYTHSEYNLIIGKEIAIQSDDKILVCGYGVNGTQSDIIVVRFNANGSIDTDFGNNGIFVYSSPGSNNDYGRAIAVQANGKIVVTGDVYNGQNKDLIVLRIEPDGILDDDFANAGIAYYYGTSTSEDVGYDISMQSDQRIVVCGITNKNSKYEILVLRYLINGKLDGSFGGGAEVLYSGSGAVSEDIPYKVHLQPNGRINVVGTYYIGATSYSLILRFRPEGILDNTFGWGGVVTFKREESVNDIAYNFTLQPDGKALIFGATLDANNDSKAFVYRFSYDGSIDANFGNNGVYLLYKDENTSTRALSGLIQADTKILVSGYVQKNTKDNGFLFRLK